MLVENAASKKTARGGKLGQKLALEKFGIHASASAWSLAIGVEIQQLDTKVCMFWLP